MQVGASLRDERKYPGAYPDGSPLRVDWWWRVNTLFYLHNLVLERVKSGYPREGVLITDQLKPGDYIGLYIDNVLVYTGVLKDQDVMQSGRKVYHDVSMIGVFGSMARGKPGKEAISISSFVFRSAKVC